MLHGSGPVPIMVTAWLLIAISAGLIIARLYLRIKIQQRRVLLSDAMMIAGWLATLAAIILTVILIRCNALQPNVRTTMIGFGDSAEDIEEIYKIFWIFNLPLFTTFYLCKGALLSMYLEIMPKVMAKRRIFLWATIIYVGIAYMISVLTLFLLCIPLETYWDLRPESTCPPVKSKTLFVVAWTLNFCGDILVFTIPWTIIQGINLRRTLKLGIYCTLLLGLVTMTFSLLRCTLVIQSQIGDASPISLAVLWSILECNLGLIITCIPSLRPFFIRNGEHLSQKYARPVAKLIDSMRMIGKIRPWKRASMIGRRASVADGGEDSCWGEEKQSRSSDVELVDIEDVA